MAPIDGIRSVFARLAEELSHLAENAASVVLDKLLLNGHDSRAVANYFLRKAARNGRPKSLTVMHLLKLTYIAHGWTLGVTGRPLIRHPVEAWMLGPVIPRIYEEFRPGTLGVRSFIRSASGVPYDAEWSGTQREIMDMVYDKYSPLSASQLSDLTHAPDAPWDQVKRRGHYAKIEDEIIRRYYKNRIHDVKVERQGRERRKRRTI